MPQAPLSLSANPKKTHFCRLRAYAAVPPCRSAQPYSHEEHSAFLDAMERYGQESTGREWEKIAEVSVCLCLCLSMHTFRIIYLIHLPSAYSSTAAGRSHAAIVAAVCVF